MSRRMALPGADELFRSTGRLVAAPEQQPDQPAVQPALQPAGPVQAASPVQLAPVTEPVGTAPSAGPREDDRLSGAARGPASGARVRTTTRRRARADADRQPTGRERHDEKITVYVSPEELLDLEQARLTLRGDHGLAVDRGRIVREALAVVLADLDAKGESSILVRRLHGR